METPHYELAQDPILRREAGEGWREFDPKLLADIVNREEIIDKLIERDDDVRELQEQLHWQMGCIRAYKEVKGIPDPPPRQESSLFTEE